MIPRARPNYGLGDLLGAAFLRGRSHRWRDRLMRQLGDWLGAEHVLLTASGRGALYLYLLAVPQRRVIIPAYTCKAVVEAARLAGKEVHYAAHEPGQFNAGVESMLEHADADTIIVATHQFGIPVDIERIVAGARRSGALVIEDVAAALGTRIDGRLAGTFGDAAFFSFDTTKLVNAPLKAGFLTVRDADIARRCREVAAEETREMGLFPRWKTLAMATALIIIQAGWMYRLFHTVHFKWRQRFTEDGPHILSTPGPFYVLTMTEWQAKIVTSQMDRLDEIIRKRRADYRELRAGLSACRHIILPPEDPGDEWAPIRFPLLVPGGKAPMYDFTTREGVDLAFSFSFIQAPEDFVEAHRIANSIVNPPYYWKLTARELEQTISVLLQADRELSPSLRSN